MRVHILQHTTESPPGTTEKWIQKNQYSVSFTRIYEGGFSFPNPSKFDFLVICGGGMDVDQEDKYPWLKEEKCMIAESLRQNKKVLGLCLGGQLIAEVLGAKVGPLTPWEFGWFPVDFEGGSLLPQEKSLMAFHCHGYSFEIPRGAQHVASSKACRNQGFQWGERVLGLQFHPETSAPFVEMCAAEKFPSGSYVQSPAEALKGLSYQPALETWYFQLLQNFA